MAAPQCGIVTKKKKKRKGKIQCPQEKIGQLEKATGVVYLGGKKEVLSLVHVSGEAR